MSQRSLRHRRFSGTFERVSRPLFCFVAPLLGFDISPRSTLGASSNSGACLYSVTSSRQQHRCCLTRTTSPWAHVSLHGGHRSAAAARSCKASRSTARGLYMYTYLCTSCASPILAGRPLSVAGARLIDPQLDCEATGIKVGSS